MNSLVDDYVLLGRQLPESVKDMPSGLPSLSPMFFMMTLTASCWGCSSSTTHLNSGTTLMLPQTLKHRTRLQSDNRNAAGGQVLLGFLHER